MPRSPDTSPQTLRVFEALLGQPDLWRYGYDLSKQTGLPSGTLYPILIRLSGRGFLETRWEEPEVPGRPPRHLYRLTTDVGPVAHTRRAAAGAARTTARRPGGGWRGGPPGAGPPRRRPAPPGGVGPGARRS